MRLTAPVTNADPQLTLFTQLLPRLERIETAMATKQPGGGDSESAKPNGNRPGGKSRRGGRVGAQAKPYERSNQDVVHGEPRQEPARENIPPVNSYAAMVSSPTPPGTKQPKMPPQPRPVLGEDRPVLVIGDSNFVRFPFTQAPWVTLARPGLRFDKAAEMARAKQLNPRRVKAVVVGIGVNETKPLPDDTLIRQMEEPRSTLSEAYPDTPNYHVQAPEGKFAGEKRARIEHVNWLARQVFRHITIMRTAGTVTGDPHYSDRERKEVARAVLSVIRERVPGMARLPLQSRPN